MGRMIVNNQGISGTRQRAGVWDEPVLVGHVSPLLRGWYVLQIFRYFHYFYRLIKLEVIVTTDRL